MCSSDLVFSSYVVEIPVSYDSDVDQALEILRDLGEAMQRDPAFAKLITRPFEVMGVDRLTENAVHLKARFTTEPRAQWKVGREFNRRLKNAFDEAGVVTPVKTVTLQRPPTERVVELRSFEAETSSPES